MMHNNLSNISNFIIIIFFRHLYTLFTLKKRKLKTQYCITYLDSWIISYSNKKNPISVITAFLDFNYNMDDSLKL
jgi:hypothetical protein